MLANGHSPFDTRIFVKESKALVRAGYTVSIIIPHTHSDVKDNVQIIAVKPAKNGFGKLMVNPFRILKQALRQPAETIFCIHDSDILLVGIFLKLIGRTVVYDAHEDTPLQIAYQHWIPKLLRRPYAWLYFLIEKLCGWLFDAIIIAEPVIGKYFPTKKTFLVRNFSSVQAFKTITPSLPYQHRVNQLVYVGLLSEARGLFEMLNAARHAHTKMSFDFLLRGKFSPPALEHKILEAYRVVYKGWIEFDDIPETLYASKIGIIIPQPNPRYKTNYPVKLFEYMAAALPVIASKEGESATFVQESQCGILVDPRNPKEVSDAIVWLFTHPEEAQAMGERGQRLIFDKYNWENEEEVLLQVYQNLQTI